MKQNTGNVGKLTPGDETMQLSSEERREETIRKTVEIIEDLS